ncbi:MAG TPA: hypothetical protein VKM55_13315 [Candidatus Lokiarchaeia archaeon]|nr:hypothetical protein [Candidatus Lokiarchaeia archaeon]
MADILGEMNYTVNTATDGYNALEFVKAHEYSITSITSKLLAGREQKSLKCAGENASLVMH